MGRKLDDFVIRDICTGELVDRKKYLTVMYKERMSKINELYALLEKSPLDLTMEDIKFLEKNEKVSLDKIPTFDKYHSTNEDIEKVLIDKLSPKSYIAMRKLIINNCSMAYTLVFENGLRMSKDENIATVLGISIDSWRKMKKELLECNVLRIIDFNKERHYKINPCCIGKKKIMTPNTYYAFRDEILKYHMMTRLQITYWDKVLCEEFGIKL